MSRRFSFFGSREPPSNSSTNSSHLNDKVIDDSASVTSEKTSDSVGNDLFGWGRRLSLSMGDSSTWVDDNVDELIRNLYQDPDILERNCVLSAKGQSVASQVDNSKGLSSLNDSISGSSAVTVNTKTAETVLSELSEEYFAPDFDPIKSLLWDISSWDDTDMTEQFMLKIEETDSNKDVVLAKLSEVIEANYSELMACMRDANDINTDLTRAINQITYGRRQISSGCDLLERGSIRIAKLQIDRDRQQLIADAMVSLKSVKDMHSSILRYTTTGELGYAAESSCTLLECLQSDLYARFNVLESIGQSVHKNLVVIRQKTDKALIRLCTRKFAVLEYNNIMKSYMLLDYMCESLGGSVSDSNTNDSTSGGCVEGLASKVEDNLLDDIDNCLQSAALEFIYASQHKKRRAAAEMAIEGAYSTMQVVEMIDLAECELVELYARLTPDLVAPCIVRSCELLAEVVHTHFMLTQWHRSPFDPRNENPVFLHRSMEYIDEEEEETVQLSLDSRSADVGAVSSLSQAVADALRLEAVVDSDPVSNTDAYSGMDAELDSERIIRMNRMRPERLVSAADKLLKSRSVVWDNILQALVLMLHSINFSAAIPVDDYLAMTWAVHAMIALGREFAESDCRVLSHTLNEKSSEYFQRLHVECHQVLRQMIDNEPWRSIPVKIGEMGGIIGIIKKNIAYNTDTCWGVRGMVGINLGLNFSPQNHEVLVGRARRPSLSGALASPSASQSPAGGSGASPFDFTSPSSDSGLGLGSKASTSSARISILELFGKYGNLLHFMTEGTGGSEESSPNPHSSSASSPRSQRSPSDPEEKQRERENVADAAASDFLAILEDDDGTSVKSRRSMEQAASMVVTQTALNGLARYAGRYLQLMHLLPSSAADIFAGLCQLFDYYLCVVFNGFVPGDERNKVLTKQTKMTAPPPDQSRDFEALQAYMERALNDVIPVSVAQKPRVEDGDHASSTTGQDTHTTLLNPTPSAGVQRRESSSALGLASAVSAATNTLTGGSVGSHPNTPVLPAQDVLRVQSVLRIPVAVEFNFTNPACFYALNERIVAAESCWFAAKILNEIKFKIMKLLPDRFLASCESYLSQYQFIAGQLRGLIYRSMCPQLVKSNYILCQITDSSAGWDTKKMKEEHHDWIDKLSANCKEVWNYMLTNDEFADAADIVREQVWLEVCQAGFDALMEGFSRVRKCTPEGRASMTMDAAVLHSNLSSIHACRVPRGRHHIDAFIQASYMPEEEMLAWIRESYQVYAYRHMLGLLTQTLASMLNSKKLKDATAMIDSLYEVETQRDDSNRLSSLFNPRMSMSAMGLGSATLGSGSKSGGDNSQLSNLFTQRLRR